MQKNTTINRLGLLLNKSSSTSLTEVTLHNNHILVTHLNCNLAAAITVYHAIVEEYNEATNYFEQLTIITSGTVKDNELSEWNLSNWQLKCTSWSRSCTIRIQWKKKGKSYFEYSQVAKLMIASTRFEEMRGGVTFFKNEYL